jgi:hypothetical protein
MDKVLKDYRDKIKKEAPFVYIKPYSHNIISMVLGAIAKFYGKEEANKAIDDFNLESLGWRKENA